jgi:iron-sulfur cluster insertion protein
MAPLLTLSDAAVNAARAFIIENAEYIGQSLRVYLAGKGCDGFEYGVSFDRQDAGDTVVPVTSDISVICDEKSLEFVQGSSIDWVDDERGRGFLVTNPNHKKFRGKFYKKTAWKDRLVNSPQPSQV